MESLTERWKQNLSLANPRSGTFVVVSSDSLVEYSRFYPSMDPDDDQARVSTVGSMYINPEFHRKGIGRKLMGTVLGAARELDCSEATLHVLAANERAWKFYEDVGWKKGLDADIGGSDKKTVPKARYRKNPL